MAAPPTDTSISKEPFSRQLAMFSGIYWVANWMELVERFAYYGVRVILPVFMVAAVEQGGPEFTHVQKGEVYGIWALVQSFVPIFTGGFADRYGYKVNIAIATVLKIIGYFVMGYCVFLAEAVAGMPLREARDAGVDHTYAIFFIGAMFLATGTAIFKPGLQGLIANQMPKKAASMGWGLFYQMVNIGGFVGPLIGGYLRVLEWEYVFILNSIAISLNFVPLFFFKEPGHHGQSNVKTVWDLIVEAVRGLLEPRLFFFTVAFAGFWLMFYQLFDILPNFIDDWIDSRGPASFLVGLVGESAVPTVNEGNLTQEWMINFNPLLISFFAFAMGYATGKLRSLPTMIAGIAVSAVAIYGLGMSMDGWWIIGAIGLFSLGEMAASPTKLRYLATIAPAGSEGRYMGYANMTVGIGWSIGSIVAGNLYQSGGDKIVLARRYLVEELGVSADSVRDISQNDLLPFFYERAGVDAWGARELLWNTYEPYSMWLIFTAIGVGSMVLLVLYDWICKAADANPAHTFNTKGYLWVRIALVPIVGGMAAACVLQYSHALLILTVMFAILFVVSFFPERKPAAAVR